MMYRALWILVASLLLPSLALAAPVKRYSFSGKVTDVTFSLAGERTTKNWMTGVSIAQSGSTVTINFRQYDGEPATWRLKKAKDGWTSSVGPLPVAPPSDFYNYCELTGTLGASFTNSKGLLASYFKMSCYANDGTLKTAWDAFGVKLRKY